MAPPADAGVNMQQAPQRFPDYRLSVSLGYVKRGYTLVCQHALTLLLVPLAAVVAVELANLYQTGELNRLFEMAKQTDLTLDLVTVIFCSVVMAVAVLSFYLLKARPVYLLDFAVAKPPDDWKISYDLFMSSTRACGKFSEEVCVFQEKVLKRSGLGQETYIPTWLQSTPPVISMHTARDEFEAVVYSAVEDVLNKTGLKPRQIGILIVNCSLFNPTPSLSAHIINRFGMRSNVVSYNLAGMGCSAGVIAVDLARQMLELQPSSYALVVSTENVTQNWYFGNNKSMLLPNCLFRAGASAVVLTNKRRERWRAKYQLQHVVRTHLGANKAAFECIFQSPDEEGIVGVRLSKELMAVAGEGLKANITTLGPLVLPVSEQLLFFANLVLRKVFKRKLRPYIPDFTLAFDKVCIHTGGRAVVDEIEKQLRLTSAHVEPSRASLYRFGNVSSASIWYVLAYMESQQGVRSGDRIWQLGFGSGFKCNSAVWRSLRNVRDRHLAWEGFDVRQLRAHLEAISKPAPRTQ